MAWLVGVRDYINKNTNDKKSLTHLSILVTYLLPSASTDGGGRAPPLYGSFQVTSPEMESIAVDSVGDAIEDLVRCTTCASRMIQQVLKLSGRIKNLFFGSEKN